MKNVEITLNPKEGNGFAIFSYKIDDFVQNKDGKIILFSNLDAAKSFGFHKVSKNNYDYHFFILTHDLQIPLEAVEYNNSQYEYYDAETGDWYLIKDDSSDQVLTIGYFVFEDGDDPESEIFYNPKKSIEIYHAILKAMGQFIVDVDVPMLAERYTKLSYGHTVLKALGTSLRFHLLFNSEIVDQNMRRKEAGLRAIPFLKNMDKYKTFFIYTTRNCYDYTKIDESVIQNAIDYVVETMNEAGYQCKYVPVEFHGFIRTTEGE